MAPVGWSIPDCVGLAGGALPVVGGDAAPAELQATAMTASVTVARGSLIVGMPLGTPLAVGRFPVRRCVPTPAHGPFGARAARLLRISHEIHERTANLSYRTA